MPVAESSRKKRRPARSISCKCARARVLKQRTGNPPQCTAQAAYCGGNRRKAHLHSADHDGTHTAGSVRRTSAQRAEERTHMALRSLSVLSASSPPVNRSFVLKTNALIPAFARALLQAPSTGHVRLCAPHLTIAA